MDEHDRIQERGSRFNFVYPDVPSNAIFDDYFSVIDSSDSLVNHLNRKSVCVITRKSTCRSMKLKPIVLDENRVLYVGYPILTTGVSLKDYNLTINDLPQHDTVIEMLFLLEGMKRSMTESEEYIHSLTQLNNQLKQYNRRYKQTEKVSLTGSWYWDFSKSKAEWSEVCCEIYGIPVTDNMHSIDEWMEYVHPEDLPAVKKKVELAHLRRKNLDFVMRIITDDGTLKIIHHIAVQDFDKTGNVIGVFGTVRDITSAYKSSQALTTINHNLERYKAAIDSSSIVCIMDANGTITHVNDRFCEVSKYDRSELIYNNINEFEFGCHSDDEMQEMWDLVSEGKIWKGEIKNKNKEGNCYWVDSTTIPFMNENGKVWQYITIQHDITIRKKAEEEIRAVNVELQEYKNAVDSVAIVSIANAEGKITHVNDLYCRTSKYMKSELIGKDFVELYAESLSPSVLQAIWLTISSGKTWKGEVMKLAKDRTPYWVESNLIPFTNEQGKLSQFISICHNVTDRKKAEENVINLNSQLEQRVRERTRQLEQKNDELESFVYTVSHDLRSPLRMINSYATLISESSNHLLHQVQLEMLQNIKRYSSGMNNIISDLLNLARIGGQALIKQEIQMNSLVEDCVQELKLQLPDMRAEICIGDLGKIFGDLGSVKLAITNLISNAIKYSSKTAHPKIEIFRIDTSNNFKVYGIKDNGVGFDSNNASRLFKPFQRLHSKEEFEGTGIGLSIVYSVISKHGGSIWAKSKEHEGATFYFTFDEPASDSMLNDIISMKTKS